MSSCELDYRLSNSSESMDYDEETDSDDDSKLQIVESPGAASSSSLMPPRTLMRSMSAVETVRDDFALGIASDAVESLLLLGQAPVVSSNNEKGVRVNGNQRLRGLKLSNVAEQRMVNYYQRMRERNNEASKRCRLKRRIKQDSLEKTRLLLESQQDTLKKRVAKLHKMKEILNNACRSTENAKGCECIKFCNMLKATSREMVDSDYSNMQLIKKSRFIRETNIEEIIGAQAPDLTDLRPLKRGPRKVDAMDFTIDADSMTIKPESPGALDLSSSSKTGQQSANARPAPAPQVTMTATNKIGISSPAKLNDLSSAKTTPVTYVTLAPKTSSISVPARTVIVDNPNPNNGLPFANLLPTTAPALAPLNKNKSTISIGGLNGTTAILLTPVNGPTTVLNLPLTPNPQITLPKTPTQPPTFLSLSSKPPPMEVLINKAEPEVVIKSEPMEQTVPEPEHIVSDCITSDATLVKTENDDIADDEPVTDTKMERDPTMCCAAVLADKEDPLSCSSDLVDLNSLTQTLDLVTMEPRSAGELTSAEKYIIKSKLEMAFWKAEESASFICTSHRNKILQENNLQGCSVCGKKRSKKLDMYIITYRMSVEFYMTNGQFLSIGQLACSGCRQKSLKGLDFSNSYILPEVGHPLHQPTSEPTTTLIKRTVGGPKEIVLNKDVVFQSSSPTSPGTQATIYPVDPRKSPSFISPTSTTNHVSQSRPDSSKARQDLNDALMALNPDFEPLGFTINSLSSCSTGVLQDTLKTTKAAMATILSTIAPGQESCLWTLIKSEMETFYSQQNSPKEESD